MTQTMPHATEFSENHTTRASDPPCEPPDSYDEKDNLEVLKNKLRERKKPILAGLAFLGVVVIGVSIAVSTGGSTNASTSSGYVCELFSAFRWNVLLDQPVALCAFLDRANTNSNDGGSDGHQQWRRCRRRRSRRRRVNQLYQGLGKWLIQPRQLRLELARE